MKPLFWNSTTKSRTTVLQSQNDVHQTTDKDVPLTSVFCETDTERFLDSAESVCYSVLQCQLKILVSRKKIGGRSWWNPRRNTWGWIHGGTKELKSEGIMTTVQTYRIKFECWCVSTNYEIFGLIEKEYPGWLNNTTKNPISLITQIPFSKVLWEFVRIKRQRRQGTREERSGEAAYWRVLGAPHHARTDSRSSGPEFVRSARVWHLWATCYVYSQEQRRRGGVQQETTQRLGPDELWVFWWDTDAWGFWFDDCFAMG